MNGRLGMTGNAVARGDSAVMKSYVPGKGYIPAVDVPVRQLRELAHGGRQRAAYQSYLKDNKHWDETRARSKAMRGFAESHGGYHSTKGAVKPNMLHHADIQGAVGNPAADAFAFKTGSRKGGKGHVFAHPATRPHILTHEAAHVAPKRSSYRFQQVTSSPRRTMREEARADYLAGIHYKDKPAPGSGKTSGYAEAASNDAARRIHHQVTGGHRMFNRPSMTGYRDVQDRMAYAGARSSKQVKVKKVDTTMSDKAAGKLAARYDTRGPLPKGLSREDKMKAYEARYIASGGKKGEKWKHRADAAEVGRNIGLAGVTAASAGFMAARGRKTGPKLHAIPKIGRHLTGRTMEQAGAGSAVLGGSAELYGEHARSRRASYANSPAGVAGSALSRMQAYTPTRRSS